MSEMQQDLGKVSEEETKFTFGDVVAEVAGEIALLAIKKTLANGKMLYFPSLGLVITPHRDLKSVEDLTEEERANNPHVR